MASSPIFRPLGTFTSNHGLPRYYIEVRGSVRVYRAMEMHGMSFLLDLHPDADHWRSLFPTRGHKIDTKAALAWFIGACQSAGEYDPPAELKPRDVGRQIGWRKQV